MYILQEKKNGYRGEAVVIVVTAFIDAWDPIIPFGQMFQHIA